VDLDLLTLESLNDVEIFDRTGLIK
jgi:hypothetical protein